MRLVFYHGPQMPYPTASVAVTVSVLPSMQFLYGPYVTVAAGCAVVLVACIGFVGACWDSRFNRIMLAVVDGVWGGGGGAGFAGFFMGMFLTCTKGRGKIIC